MANPRPGAARHVRGRQASPGRAAARSAPHRHPDVAALPARATRRRAWPCDSVADGRRWDRTPDPGDSPADGFAIPAVLREPFADVADRLAGRCSRAEEAADAHLLELAHVL